MEKSLKGTKTEANLWKAFAGESQARNKYTYYASKAKKEGYEQIAAIFQETADQEKEHAKIWFKLVHGIEGTAENLVDAAAGENRYKVVPGLLPAQIRSEIYQRKIEIQQREIQCSVSLYACDLPCSRNVDHTQSRTGEVNNSKKRKRGRPLSIQNT